MIMGTLFLVATPIGNLKDISPRALSTLRQVNLIAAEDTRQTNKLLAHYGIKTSLTSYYEHNKISKLDHILSVLSAGDVALVSDAGTPGLNDPGYELVQAALSAGYPVSSIPGPSAPVAALVVSGLPTDAFLYLGYLPRKTNDRRRALSQIANLPYTLIFLETPHRLLPALEDLLSILGNRKLAIARELTKLHEEIFRGTLREGITHFTENTPRGEFTLVVAGQTVEPETWSDEEIKAAIQDYLSSGVKPSQIAAELADRSGWPRREIYKRITQRENGT